MDSPPSNTHNTPFRIEDAQSNRSNSPFGIYAPKGGILNENWCKTIIMEVKEPPKKKEIKQKQKQKRQVTRTDRWQFSESDLNQENQYTILYDLSHTPFIHQQIKNKLSSYRSQDIEKNLFDPDKMADLQEVLQKMETCQLKCFSCKESVFLLYENVREPKQWTLERIDNKVGHTKDNVEIACLSCNLRRRTMYHERYVFTKNIKTIVKTG